MNKINLKGVTSEAVSNILILLVSLINAVLQMLGVNILPIENETISVAVSAVFVIGSALWNTWKNRNLTTVAQKAQIIINAVKTGLIDSEEFEAFVDKCRQ